MFEKLIFEETANCQMPGPDLPGSNMKSFNLPYCSLLIAAICGALFFLAPPGAAAQQQQKSNAYVFWDFGDQADNVENIDQKIRIAKTAPGTQWVMTWTWAGDSHGGYLGFNIDEQGKGQALFSLWNADQAKGPNCQTFGGEGEGWSCRMPFEVNPETVYGLRLARTRVEASGVWWSAWIIENAGSDSPTEHFLGEIHVSPQSKFIRGNSINDFSEYFGRVVPECRQVPVSLVFIAPPAANREKDSDNYVLNSRRNGNSNPNDNPCRNGDESEGNFFKIEDYDFGFGAGALMFIGGTADDYTMPEGAESE